MFPLLLALWTDGKIANSRPDIDMLIYHRTSLFESRAQTLVNPVNTVGVMGKGLANEFKIRNPSMFKRYQELCHSGELTIGKLWLWKGSDQWVLNFPTKKHWRHPSKLEYIEQGLRKLVDSYDAKGIREIAFPRLGCGHGGLDWSDVQPLMESYLKKLPIVVYIHDYNVELPIPEHVFAENLTGGATFELFLSDIRTIVENSDGELQTLSKNSPFRVEFDDGKLFILTEKKRNTVFEDDLFDLWVTLQSSPVSTSRMVGSANTFGHYLLAILSRIPYLRLVRTSRDISEGRLAIERIRNPLESKSVRQNASFATHP